MDAQQQAQYHHGGQDGRGEDRTRMIEQYPQHTQLPQQIHPQPNFTPHPLPGPSSPPPTSSPFAFAPPPLSSNPARPILPLHHSEPPPHNPQFQHYSPKPPMAPHHHSFPTYPGSAPMGHRSFSNEHPRQSPTQAHLTRPGASAAGPSLSSPGIPPLPSAASPYTYARQLQYPGPAPSPQLQSPHHLHQQSPRPGLYAPQFTYQGGPHAQPQAGAAEMPRSVSYPANAYQTHHPYQPIYAHHPHPVMVQPPTAPAYQHYQPIGPPALSRNDTSTSITNGLAEVEIGRQPPGTVGLGYAIPSRPMMIERPYRCDECVQSFNRNHDLKRHKRIHLSVKPYGCDVCGKTFSRKDALRRHWMVKGCRGEEGATAPIYPLFPIKAAACLSPPTPALEGSPTIMSSNNLYPSSTQGFNHPSAPPPLSSLPSRQPSAQSLVIITPNDPNTQHLERHVGVAPPLDEPHGVDPMTSVDMRSGQGSASSSGDGYFDGVVGLKSDGTAVLEKAQESPIYPTTAHPSHPHFHHPYRRTSNFTSPHQQSSPTVPHHPQARPYTPSTLGGDGKPVFAMPFVRPEYNQIPNDGMFVPQVVEMEKQSSQMSHASEEYQAAPRWHRPSFPFPPTNNVYNPNYNPDLAATQPVSTHGYGQ